MLCHRGIGIGILLGLLAGPGLAQEAAPTVEELWRLLQRQQAEIEALEQALAMAEQDISAADRRLEQTEQQVEATGEYVESLELAGGTGATTVGGYGELHYNDLAADNGQDVEEIDYHRFVLFFGHRFNDRLRFFSELELEHSFSADGEPGEVELEQAYLDFSLGERLSAQAGLFLVPVGMLNETHEPPTFFGVERNGVENVIIPSTWWEAGAGLSGRLANGLSWNAALHSGLAMPTAGGSAFRVRSGRQKVAEAVASDWASTFRLRYTGVPGLDIAASLQYQSDPSQVAGDGLDSGTLFSAHLIYQAGDFTLKSLYGQWSFDGQAVEAAGADKQTGWFVEPSYRLGNDWAVYARYEDVDGARLADRFSQWEAGFNYWPVQDVVVKFDYRRREHSLAALAAQDFDGIDIGVGYQF